MVFAQVERIHIDENFLTPEGKLDILEVVRAVSGEDGEGGGGNGADGERDALFRQSDVIVLTAPLTDDQARALIPSGAAVSDSKFVLNYYRLSADNRLIFGGGEKYTPRPPADVAGFVRRYLERVFPQLKGIAIDHAWGGMVGVTFNRLPHVGRTGNAFYAHGWSGHGVLVTTLAGQLIAEAMQGTAEQFDLFANLPGKPFPGGPLLRHPLSVLGMLYYALRDRL